MLAKSGVLPTICSCTREEYLGTKLVTSCIDHINVRAPFFCIDSAVIKHKLADHYFVGCHVYLPTLKKVSPEHLQVSVLDVAKFDSLVNDCDWNTFMAGVIAQDVYTKFVHVIDTFKRRARKTMKIKKTQY